MTATPRNYTWNWNVFVVYFQSLSLKAEVTSSCHRFWWHSSEPPLPIPRGNWDTLYTHRLLAPPTVPDKQQSPLRPGIWMSEMEFCSLLPQGPVQFLGDSNVRQRLYEYLSLKPETTWEHRQPAFAGELNDSRLWRNLVVAVFLSCWGQSNGPVDKEGHLLPSLRIRVPSREL